MPAAVTYTTVLGQVLMENRGGIVTEFVPDPLGSVVKHKDSTGAYVHSAEYWPYGEIQSSTGNNPNNFAYCGTWGYYRDNASQTYVRARYYKPVQGRWMTVDPLWPSEFAFLYVYNMPVSATDMSGLQIGSYRNFTYGRVVAKFVLCGNAAEQALEETAKLCKDLNLGSPSGNGICNAIQHCLWACYTAQKTDDKEFAKECTDMHERNAPYWCPNLKGYRPNDGKPPPPGPECMDLANNRIGIQCSDATSCSDCCLSNAKRGNLQIIDDWKPLPPGWRKGRTDCKDPRNWARPRNKG